MPREQTNKLSTWTKGFAEDYAKKYVKKYEKPLTFILSAVCLTLLLLNMDFNFLEANLYDLRMSRGIQSKANRDIVLVTLDDATTKEFNEFAPMSLDYHTRLLETLAKAQPKAVGYLIDLNHVSQNNPEMVRGDWGVRFVNSAKRLEEKGAVFLLGTPFDVTGEVLPQLPMNDLPHSVAVIHKDGNVFAEDKVTRRALLTLYDKPAFHLDLARRLHLIGRKELPMGSFYVPEIDGKYFFFKYHGSTVLQNKRRPNEITYPRYSFADVLKERIPVEALKNKIILVGTMSMDDSSDFAYTPYSKASFSNPKLLVHADILDSIIQNDGIMRVPHMVNCLVTLLVTTIVLWWIMTSTPLYGVFATLSLALAFILLSQLLFQMKGLWLRESQPLVGIFVGYYLAVPYRLIREYKKRWDYQRKNELLTQVEELKTNFLSLVTHDLKTPVARIQGLAEVLLRSAAETLALKDRETVKHIIASTEELNRFISSILELNKVESNHIQLRRESKDINDLVERSLEGFKAQARARNIRIVSNLEPLFPVKIDASLISKVLNNLIDNALKYSPVNSEIIIESKEEGDWIIISVKDQGIGMTLQEQENLFTRFYRAKNDMTVAIAGTGLGLYLTKYFIEAHRGHVEVESEKNQGSIFRIFLPINEDLHVQNSPKGLTRGVGVNFKRRDSNVPSTRR